MLKIYRDGEADANAFFARTGESAGDDVSETVRRIIADVRERGEAAIFEYSERFDGARPRALEATPDEINAAVKVVEPEFLEIMARAAANIESFHSRQTREGFVVARTDGVVTGQRVLPIDRVGVYIPGGTAGYPSSALMNCIPAKIAGVGEIILATPPGADGGIKNPYVAAAARLAGADRIFKIGGAQAIAALAYGVASVPAVDKIVGPGNAYVAEAKRQVYGKVGIDMIAGPSEIIIIADEGCEAGYVAADMLAQAEHDERARAVLITLSAALAEAVRDELRRRLPLLPRAAVAAKSLKRNGGIIVTDTLERAVEIANAAAPEHLELCVGDPFALLPLVKNAGSVFLGRHCPEAVGDYYAGPNHTLPTAGTARFYSPLSVDDFTKRSSFTYYSPRALTLAGADIEAFAEKEGLRAHAESVRARTLTANDRRQPANISEFAEEARK
jgi:histidinol dehydrogenase